MKPARLAAAQTVCRILPPILSQRLRTLIYPMDRAESDDYEYVVRAQTGSLFKNTTGDFHGYPFSVHGYSEWRNWAIALALCSPGDTIIEIGANVGTETVGFADIIGNTGKVYAFEPLPSNVQALTQALEISRHQNVTVLTCALGEHCQRAHFAVPSEKRSSGIGHLLGLDEDNSSATIEVDCMTLDSLSDRVRPARVMFADTEGAEVSVLRGARDYIGRYQPFMVLEASAELLARAGSSIEELYLTVSDLGYQATRISRFGLARVERGGPMTACNWFCVPSTKLEAVRIVDRSLRVCGLLPCIPGLNPLRRKRTPL
jgi:FkbM family methyltransferase